MAERSLTVHVDQTAQIIRRLITLKPRLRVEMPQDLARARARLDALHPGGQTKNAADYDLLYQVGVTLSQHEHAMTMGELSRTMGVPLSTATRMVNWMVESGYVERLPDPEDRRVVRVGLTQSGQKLMQVGDQFIRLRAEQILRVFTVEERQTLILLLQKLVHAMEEERQ